MVGDLILYLTRKIVEKPDEISLQKEVRGKDTTVKLTVSEQDLGRVIGRKGRVIEALRLLANACAQKEGQTVHIELEGKKRM